MTRAPASSSPWWACGVCCVLIGCVGTPTPSPSGGGVEEDASVDASTDLDSETDRGRDAAMDTSTDVSTQPDASASEDAGTQPDMDEPDAPVEPAQPWWCDQPAFAGGERQAYAGESWANLQHPPSLRVDAGSQSDPIYGQLWVPGATDASGAAPGWSAQALIGPLGTHPYTHGECWRRVPATFNVDVGNNDEYTAIFDVASPGLYAYMMRYAKRGELPGIVGDLDGPNDGARADRAGVMEVSAAVPPDDLVVVTLNLRCQADDWAARRPLVLEALARLEPDVVALQEDCAVQGEAPQSLELRGELAARTGRGYAWRRVVTHQAEHDGDRFDEGLALLSAWPLDALVPGGVIDLPHVNFPRKAQAWTLRVAGAPVHVLATHFDYSAQAAQARDDSAAALLAALPPGERAVVLGDLNATPDSAAYGTLDGALRDLWVEARPGASGETIPAWAPTRRIDYVFATGAFGPTREAVLLDERDGDTWLSDHLGVAVTVGWAPGD